MKAQRENSNGPQPISGKKKSDLEGLKLKVCGMKSSENIEEIAKLQPDYMGFIFFEKSPRNFDAEIPRIDKNIKKTGVFVDASSDFILEKAKKHGLAAIQLHGKESPELCATLKSEGLEVIKVFSVKNNFNFDALQQYEGKVDYFLFDTKGKAEGGNGITFNWEILREYPSETPFFLSGGIGLEEVNSLKKYTFPKTFYGIDVNSRFETEPGLKNPENLKELKKIIIPQR